MTGVDISSIQLSFVLTNVRFFMDGIDQEWNYSEHFDYMNSRMRNLSIQMGLNFRKRP